jgi:hypothetical protein
MQTKLANDSSRERYVVEIDGITKSEYSAFAKALQQEVSGRQAVLKWHGVFLSW